MQLLISRLLHSQSFRVSALLKQYSARAGENSAGARSSRRGLTTLCGVSNIQANSLMAPAERRRFEENAPDARDAVLAHFIFVCLRDILVVSTGAAPFASQRLYNIGKAFVELKRREIGHRRRRGAGDEDDDGRSPDSVLFGAPRFGARLPARFGDGRSAESEELLSIDGSAPTSPV